MFKVNERILDLDDLLNNGDYITISETLSKCIDIKKEVVRLKTNFINNGNVFNGMGDLMLLDQQIYFISINIETLIEALEILENQTKKSITLFGCKIQTYSN